MEPISVGLGLFVYERPGHTRTVLEGLKENRPAKLYVFSDGPKQGRMSAGIEETRRLVRSIDWCATEIVEHPQNLGTVGSLTWGIDHMMKNHDAVIVLEDDCVWRADSYMFMVCCLDYYKDEARVFHVNGYQLPIHLEAPRPWDVYFSPLAMSWGWGTWKRAWKYFRLNVDDAREYFRTPSARRLLDVVPDFAQRIKDQLEGRVDSWTYRWNFIINKNDGLCVSPYRSYVFNIGWDGKGVHCGHSRRYEAPKADWQRPRIVSPNVLRLPRELVRDGYMDRQTRRFYRKKPEILIRAYRQWKSLWRRV